MLRRLLDRLRRRADDDRPAGETAPRDYGQERDDSRRARLGDEDRAWEEASLQRDRDRRERDPSPPEG